MKSLGGVFGGTALAMVVVACNGAPEQGERVGEAQQALECGIGLNCQSGYNCCLEGTTFENEHFVCSDPYSDPKNCGKCGNVCAASSICTSDACYACGRGETVCSNTCADLMTDPQNCGACGHSCGTGAWICTSGQCGCPDTVCPDGSCSDLTGNNDCGACGNVCSGVHACCPSGTGIEGNPTAQCATPLACCNDNGGTLGPGGCSVPN